MVHIATNGSGSRPIDIVLSRLEGVRQTGPDTWISHCPAHNDRDPSLSEREKEDGSVLLHCHAGCSIEDVLAAAGLTMRDLFCDGSAAGKATSPVLKATNGGMDRRRKVKSSTIDTIYDYCDRRRRLLYQVVRYRVEYDDGAVGKTFRQRQPSGRDWVNNLTGVERVLYLLPDLLASTGTVYLVEGEKDADRLVSLGITATTLAQGAQAKLTPSMIEDLAGRDIVILPDNDKPGRDAAETRAVALHGVAHSTKVVHLPGLPEHGDVSDWLDAGHTIDDLRSLVEEAPEWNPNSPPADDPGSSILLMRKASEITPQATSWLWNARIVGGMLNLLSGFGGVGKSTFITQLVAAITTGGLFPDGERAPLGDVMILAGEDSPAHTIIPRLIAAGADLSRVHIVEGIHRPGVDEPAWISLREDAHDIEQAIVSTGSILLVIDPASSFIGDADTNSESHVRNALVRLDQGAQRTGCAVLLVRHLAKGSGNSRADARILGSVAWRDQPRSVLMIADAPEEYQPAPRLDGRRDVRRALGVTKANLAPIPPVLWFEQPADGPMHWLEGHAPFTMDDCFRPAERPTKLDDATGFVREQLIGGSQTANQLYADGKSLGYSEKTIRRALRAINAEKFQLPGRAHAGWCWRLPNGAPVRSGSLGQESSADAVWPSDQVTDDRSLDHDSQVRKVTAIPGISHLQTGAAGSFDTSGQLVSWPDSESGQLTQVTDPDEDWGVVE